VPEVRELYERMTGATPAAGVAEAVRAQTEGNPLFATETIRHLDAEGLLGAESEAVLRSVPEGLRDVIGRRLGELSTATTNVLSLAAVVGREFRLEILEALSGGSAPQIPRALSEARAARIIEEDVGQGAVGTYRFNHALFRQYLYERIPAAQRVAIHLDCAAAFEARYGSNGDRIDVIAEHLAHSSDPRDLERASCLSEDAARRALAVHAFADGARIARRAIDSFQRAGTEDRERRCELLLLLGDALNHTGQPRIAIDDALEKAFTLAEAAGDRSRALRACLLAREGLQLMHQGGSSFPTETAFWAARLDRHALPGTRERIYADDNLIALDVLRGTFTASDPSFQRLKKRAWQIGDPETCWLAGGSHLMFQRQPVWDEDRLATIDAMLKLPREGVPTHVLQQGLQFLCTVLLEFGHRVRAEQVRDELLALARRSGDLSTRVWAGRMVYFLAVVDGRLEYGLQTLAAPDAEVIASGIFTDPFNRPEAWGFRAMLLVGRKPPLPVPVPSLLAGPDGAPGSRADRLRQALAGTAHWRAGSVLQHALAVGDTESAAVWVDYFKGTRQVTNSLVLINRLLGEAHVLLGHPDEGRASLERGLEQAQAMRFRPEVALTRVSLATALIGYYPGERDEAHEHLGTAIPELREMGMRPGLERAEALLARLEGERPPGTIRDRRAGGLTGREAEVLRLVAAGRTNRQISEELVLSIRTVERHIANIYAKIDAHGKADATAFAIRHNLV
jgi:DNA-binding CsgD family transcriptional regulator